MSRANPFRIVLVSLVVAAQFAACASPARRKSDAAQAAAEEAAIASAMQALASQKQTDYKLSPADLLQITVYQEKDLEREVRVNASGDISFPMVGTVRVGGLSVIDAQNVLAQKLKDYLINPQVTFFIKEYGNKNVYVLGQVKKPGSYPLPTEASLTVVEAISMAEGFTPIAAPDRTKVIRNNNGKSETFTVQVSAVTRLGEKNKDVTLQPGDVVYVPQSFF